MQRRRRVVFLLLILAQMAHSIEEYLAKLYEVFAPARFVSGIFSRNLALGFVILNASLIAFGFWCWAVPLRSGWKAPRGLLWFWTILELGNGIGHIIFAVDRQGYFPGVLTAPFLLLFAGWLALLQIREPGGRPAG